MNLSVVKIVWLIGTIGTALLLRDPGKELWRRARRITSSKTNKLCDTLEVIWDWSTQSVLWPFYWVFVAIVNISDRREARSRSLR